MRMFQTLDTWSLERLENFQGWYDWIAFWGLIIGGVLLAVLGPSIASFRSKVEERITVLKSEQSAAEQRTRTDKLQKQVARLQPRSLSPTQRETIKKAISPFAGQKVQVMCLTWDLEASRYAEDFISVFKDAGWDCGPIYNSTFPLDFENVLVTIRETPREEVPPGAWAINEALIRAGVARNKGQLVFSPVGTQDEITVRIGARPPVLDSDESTSGSDGN